MMLIVITKTAKSFAVCKTFADFKNLVCRIFETRTKYREERIEGFIKKGVCLDFPIGVIKTQLSQRQIQRRTLE